MAVSPADFRAANGHFLSLTMLKTDSDGWITAIAVTIEGISGGENVSHRYDRRTYRLLVPVHDLQSGIPTVWIASPPLILSFGVSRGCDLRYHVEDGVLDVMAAG